jgi:hypothetical protein
MKIYIGCAALCLILTATTSGAGNMNGIYVYETQNGVPVKLSPVFDGKQVKLIEPDASISYAFSYIVNKDFPAVYQMSTAGAMNEPGYYNLQNLEFSDGNKSCYYSLWLNYLPNSERNTLTVNGFLQPDQQHQADACKLESKYYTFRTYQNPDDLGMVKIELDYHPSKVNSTI